MISVVIPTFNRKKVLKKLLKSLEKQEYYVESQYVKHQKLPLPFEVIVVVDGSTDGTQEWLEQYKKEQSGKSIHKARFNLRWFDTGLTDRYGLAIARNIGIREAVDRAAVVLLDDDSFPTKTFLMEHLLTVKKGVLTGGWRESTDPEDSMHSKMQEYLEVYGDCEPKDFIDFTRHKNPYVVENNTCMLKEDWLATGLFDESVNEYGTIAQPFIERLKEMGYKYQFNPRAKIIHKAEYKRSYGNRTRKVRRTPMWVRRIKVKIKANFPTVYNTIKNRTFTSNNLI